jgi:ornithine cyclodeaminase/alanine dehydrogenase-like protein (mu-crystallin family)
MTLVLSNAEIAELVTMQDCIATLEDAYIELGEGRGAFRGRSDICTPSDHASGGMYALKSMDGVIPKLGVGAIRINSDIITYPEIDGVRRRKKVPAAPGERYTGLVLLFSTKTGEPLAILPDGMMQPMRVAATTALGAKCLAREDAEVVALLGSGVQARGQVRAIVQVRKVKEIRVYSTRKDKREAFAAEMSPLVGLEIEPVDAPERAVRGADIVLTATNALVPVLAPEWIENGMHLSTIKAGEVGPDVIRRVDVKATLVRDLEPVFISTHGLRVPEEASGGMASRDAVTLPELLIARRDGQSRGRTANDQVTCFLNPQGLGFQFAAVGAAIYRKAKELGRGRELPTDWFTETEVP